MKFRDENIFDLFSRLLELYGLYARPMPGDERLIKLLNDKEVISALDRYIEHRDRADKYIVQRAIMPGIISSSSDRVFELARTWVAVFVKAQKGESLSQPKKVVFHWRSSSNLGHPEWNQLYMITLEDPDPVVSKLADFEDYTGTPEDEREDEDEIVIFFDGIDVRKKVFYAPFDQWDSSLTSRLSLPQHNGTQEQRPMRPTNR